MFENEFFTGGLMLALLGGVIALLRFLPHGAWQLVQRWLTTTVYVRDEELVAWLADWLGEQRTGTRWYMGLVRHSRDGSEPIVFPGRGFHIVRALGRRFLLWCSLEDNGIRGQIVTFTIRCYGRDKAPVERLLESVKALREQREAEKNVTYLHDAFGEWFRLRIGSQRRLRSIVLPGDQAEQILRDAKTFLASRETYETRGVPYRRGYLFQGPPGNGKSTMIQVLATELRIPIYALALTDSDLNDARLAKALGSVPDRALLVLEDADRLVFSKLGVSESGLLNAIDGSLASEGRIFIVTANEPEKLDKAFRRRGRLDKVFTFPCPGASEIERMIACSIRVSVN